MSESCAISSLKNRLRMCEVCSGASAKYTCPECELRTCSLNCVKIHKTELECSGIRSRVKYKRLGNFDNLDILNDYKLLEETGRVVEAAKRTNFQLFKNKKSFLSQRSKAHLMIFGSRKKEIGLKLLPPNFAEHLKNTTKYCRKTNEFFWKVKWIFQQGNEVEIIENGLPDATLLRDCVGKYLSEDFCSGDRTTKTQLSPYIGREVHTVEVLLPAQGLLGKKYFLLNMNETIAENLKYKNIIEHPVFHLILEENLHDYQIVHIVVKNKNLLECNEEDVCSDDGVGTN